ncbi:MAG: hypothetical protein AAF654_00890 [Myxococcota bacterium]
MYRIALAIIVASVVGCAGEGAIDLDLSPLRQQAALTGIPLDRITLSVSAPDIQTIQVDLEPTDTEVTLEVTPGPSRRFALEGITNLADPQLAELAAYFGEVTRDVVTGPNELTVPFREQGAIRLNAEVVGGATLGADDRVILIDDQDRTVPVTFGQPTVLRAGTYTIGGGISSIGPLRAPSGTAFEIVVGALLDATVPLFSDQTQCLESAPEVVRADGAGCVEVPIQVTGLALPNVEIFINGVAVELETLGDLDTSQSLPDGQLYDVQVVSTGGNPVQECTITNGRGVASDDGGTITIACEPPRYRVDLEVAGNVGTGFTLLAETDNEQFLGQTTVTASGSVETGLFVPLEVGGDAPILSVAGLTAEGINCIIEGELAITDSAVAPGPLNAFCSSPPVPAYTGFSNLGSYVSDDGDGFLSASGTGCAPDEQLGIDVGFDACLHAGLIHRFDIPGYASCEGLTISDSSGVLRWSCDASSGQAVAFSYDLLTLRTAVTSGPTPRFLSITPTVQDAITPRTITGAPFFPWTNPVLDGDTAGTHAVDGAVYVFDSPANNITISGQRTTVVTVADAVIGNGSSTALFVSGAFGTVDADIENSRVSGEGVLLGGIYGTFRGTIDDVGVEGESCLAVTGDYARIYDAAISGCSGSGIDLGGEFATVENVTINGTDDNGVLISSSHQRLYSISTFSTAASAIGTGFTAFAGDLDIRRIRMGRFTNRDRPAIDLTYNNLSGGELPTGARIEDVLTYANGGNPTGLRINNYNGTVMRNIALGGINGSLVSVSNANNTYFEGVLIDAQGETGMSFSNTNNTVLRDIAVDGQFLRVSTSSEFRIEGNAAYDDTGCSISGTNIGVDTSCGLLSPSTGTQLALTSGFAADIVGEVSDSVAGYTLGSPVAFGTITNLFDFETESRIWTDLSLAFGGDCSNCSVVDFAPGPASQFAGLSTGIGDLVARTVVTRPAANDQAECDLRAAGSTFNGGACEVTFLVRAGEVSGDGDGFCESGETCAYWPNVGVAQAAEFSSSQPVSVAGVESVTLLVP